MLTNLIKELRWQVINKKPCHLCRKVKRFIWYDKTTKPYVKNVTKGVNYCCRKCVKKQKNKYQWQGENIKVEFGYCHVKENTDKPLWWYNYECNMDGEFGKTLIDCIRITTSYGKPFIISNHCGIGVHKLMNGGWPNYAHFSLDGKFTESHWEMVIRKFDLNGYEQHESNRGKWQEKNFPEEYKQKKSLRASFARSLPR